MGDNHDKLLLMRKVFLLQWNHTVFVYGKRSNNRWIVSLAINRSLYRHVLIFPLGNRGVLK